MFLVERYFRAFFAGQSLLLTYIFVFVCPDLSPFPLSHFPGFFLLYVCLPSKQCLAREESAIIFLVLEKLQREKKGGESQQAESSVVVVAAHYCKYVISSAATLITLLPYRITETRYSVAYDGRFLLSSAITRVWGNSSAHAITMWADKSRKKPS